MPMNFLTLESLAQHALSVGFRPPREQEPEPEYRAALAQHVAAIDPVESHEIATGKG